MNQTRQAICHTILPDGRQLAVQARAEPPAPPATLKMKGSESQVLQQAVLRARTSEMVYDDGWRVVVEGLSAPTPEFSQWLALPAILVDRSVRGLLPGNPSCMMALGLSTDWIAGIITPPERQAFQHALQHLLQTPDLGQVELFLPAAPDSDCSELYQRLRQVHPAALLRELDSLASLQGQATLGARQRRVKTWFPLAAGGGHSCLQELELVLHPLGKKPSDADDPIEVIGGNFNAAEKLPFQSLLRGLRDTDRHGSGEWATLLELHSKFMVGDSWQLALAMADRLARGRDFAGYHKLIATGQMGISPNGEPNWHVMDVGGVEEKCAVMLAAAQTGTRILLPASWSKQVPPNFVQQVRDQGGSVAFVSKIA